MTNTSRRAVLVAGGAIGVAGALAACGGGSGSATTTSSSSSSGATPLGPSAEVPVSGGKVYENAQVVVTQPMQGEFKAFSAVCPHQGCLVSNVVDNVIACPCHGSLFNATTGAVEQGPAVQGLAPVAVKDSNGTLVLE
jgi:Rieske Fe-S protein